MTEQSMPFVARVGETVTPVYTPFGFGYRPMSAEESAIVAEKVGDHGTYGVFRIDAGKADGTDATSNLFLFNPITLANLSALIDCTADELGTADRALFDQHYEASARARGCCGGGEGGSANEPPAPGDVGDEGPDRDTADTQEEEPFPDAGWYGIDKSELARTGETQIKGFKHRLYDEAHGLAAEPDLAGAGECGQAPCEHAPDGGNHPVAAE